MFSLDWLTPFAEVTASVFIILAIFLVALNLLVAVARRLIAFALR